MQVFKDRLRGIKRCPWKTAGYGFTAFSVLFTIIKGICHFLPSVEIKGCLALAVVILISALFGLIKIWKPFSIKIAVANFDTEIEVTFGDIFVQNGIRVVPVNEFFDSVLGKPVSENSLHGLFLNKCFSGHPQPFDNQVDKELANEQCETIFRSEGKTKKYKIGTTAMVGAGQDKYLVFALTHTDVSNCMATANVTMMWDALQHVLQRARVECSGYPLNLPLVGSGLSKIGLSTCHLLNLIILAVMTETKVGKITKRIRIVLHRDRFEDIDLRDIQNYWKE